MAPKPITSNTLFYGDNLDILREYVPDESVDLIYLDPPFNSNRTYNVLFKDESGKESEAQITAFEDTWNWNEAAARTYHELVTQLGGEIGTMIGALHSFIGDNQVMAYLVMMAARLVELRRVLKPTGSLYLHCDPTASHYLKVILDTIFVANGGDFQNEIIWSYQTGGASKKRYARKHDVIFFYTKSETFTFNSGAIREPRTEKSLKRAQNPKGARISTTDIDKLPTDVFQVPALNPMAVERLGYPTQKPLALLERVIRASSNPADVVLDPFCGCGTAIVAAQKLGRRWIGIDITHLSIALQKNRLKDMFSLTPGVEYKVIGEPEDTDSARLLAKDDPYQFQWWALSLIQARPLGGEAGSKQGKKGSDRGIDGIINFIDDPSGKPKRVLVQVKGGANVKSGDVRDLRGTVEREGAAIGVFITLEPPTKEMEREAVAASFYRSPGLQRDYPKLQILTIANLLKGAEVKMPQQAMTTFKQARMVQEEADQYGMDL